HPRRAPVDATDSATSRSSRPRAAHTRKGGARQHKSWPGLLVAPGCNVCGHARLERAHDHLYAPARVVRVRDPQAAGLKPGRIDRDHRLPEIDTGHEPIVGWSGAGFAAGWGRVLEAQEDTGAPPWGGDIPVCPARAVRPWRVAHDTKGPLLQRHAWRAKPIIRA